MRKYRISVPLTVAASLLAVSLTAQVSTSVVHSPEPGVKAAKPGSKSQASPAPKLATLLLPVSFAGWQSASSPQKVTDAAQADPANAAALKEYGLTDALLSDYTRDSDTLKIRALRFVDASGAYGAYSFYRQSGWPREQVGTGAASDNNRVLFWIGNVVVDAQFSHISAMSGSELRELASAIPLPAGNKSLAPPILASLPQKDMDGQSTHYALGPAGYAGPTGAANLEGVLPPGLVGFDRGAETATIGGLALRPST